MGKAKNRHSQTPEERRMVAQQTFTFSGPLPHPNDLARYEQIAPGAAERIIAMAEKQAAHRQELEKKVIESGIKNSNKGLNYGLFIGLAFLVAVGYCAYLNLPWLAGVIGAIDLGSLVGVFVYGTMQRKKERLEKNKD